MYGRVPAIPTALSGEVWSLVVGSKQSGQPEIEDLQSSILREAQVGGFQITVHDALIVRGCEPLSDLQPEVPNFVFWDATGQDALRDAHAGDVFHHDEIDTVLGVEVMDRRNVGVIDSRERQSFLSETPSRALVGKRAAGSTLIATSRSSRSSRARYTTPMPPAPMCSSRR